MFTGSDNSSLTIVQGKLKEVETRKQKMINNLVWDGKKASINLNTMSAPSNEGGI